MTVSVSAINAITKQNFIPKLIDNVNTSNVLLYQLQKKGRFENLDGGQDIRVPVRYARFGSRGWYSGGQLLNTAYNEKKTALVFDWAQHYINITVTGLDKLKNAGENKVIDHVKSELQAAEEDIKDSFGTGLYNAGTTANAILGCRTYLSTSATYGGIASSGESWLQAQVDSTTTSLSLGKMQALYEAASQPPIRPDLITCVETVFNSYWSLLQPQQRFQDSESADAGFKNLMFNGAAIYEDSYCPASTLVMHNTDFLSLYSHSQRKFPGDFKDFQEFFDQDAMIAKMLWAGAFVCSAPRFQGIMNALTS